MTAPIPWQRAIRFGFVLLALLLFGFGGLTASIPIQSAIVAPGRLVLAQSTHWVQHPQGGRVKELAVKQGQRVTEGTVLLVLSDENLAHQHASVLKQLLALHARHERLTAQRDQRSTITFERVDTPAGKVTIPEASKGAQIRFLAAAQLSKSKQDAQRRQRQATVKAQVSAAEAQVVALKEQLDLLTLDLTQNEALMDKGIVAVAALMPLRHQIAEGRGDLAALEARKAALKGNLVDIDLEAERQSASLLAEVVSELDQVNSQIFELTTQLESISAQQKGLSLRAPFAGYVHDLRITTAQTVLRGTDPAMAIVPLGSGSRAHVRVAPREIDSISAGQQVRVHLDGHGADVWQTGKVAQVSADVFGDASTGQSYFQVEIVLDAQDSVFADEARLGMPVTAYFVTQSTSVLSYLLAPLRNSAMKAFREA